MKSTPDRIKAALADRYAIESELGAGGMATVYLAEDLKHHRKVAVKVLRPELAAALGPDRFIREIEIAAQLHHPHILALFDSGEADGFVYYVMPLVKGESLRDKLKREGKLSTSESARILRDVVDALAEAHAHGVVHRDIKPDNVMLSGRHALVMDFGVAKAVSEAGQDDLTTVGLALGTPTYMAPEQAAAESNVDHRADIYAVGVMAYEMLSGAAPFTGANAQQVVSAHLTKDPVPIATHQAAVPDELSQMVMRCLQKDTDDRWQSAAELIPPLEALAARENEIVARRAHPIRVGALYALASLAVAAVAYGTMYTLGLPDWTMYGAVVLLLFGLPIMMLTGLRERRRILVTTASGESVRAVDQPQGNIWRLFTWKRSLLGGALAFAALGLVVTTFMASRALGIGPAATLLSAGVLGDRDVIVLAEFEDHAGDSLLALGLTSGLRTDLSQSPTIRILDPRSVVLALRRMGIQRGTQLDVQLARELAEREGAAAVLYGEVNRIGSAYSLSATLESTDGVTLLQLRETAVNEDDIIEALSRLSPRVRTTIGESLRDVRASRPLPRVTTHSLEALRKFAQARRLGSNERAIPLLEEAIAFDSGFAAAHRYLATAYANTGRRANQLAAIQQAYRYRDRATEVVRLEIEAFYHAWLKEDQAHSVRAYERIAEMKGRPSNNLANAYTNARRLDDAERAYRGAIDFFGGTATTYGNFISNLIAQGKLEEADSVLLEFRAVFPAHPWAGSYRAALEYARGDRDRARGILDSLSNAYPSDSPVRAGALRQSGLIALTQGNVSQARRLFNLRFEVERTRRRDQAMLAAVLDQAAITILVAARADSTTAVLEQVTRGFDLDPFVALDRSHLRFAELAARGGEPNLARHWIDRWRNEVDSLVQTATVERHVALGELALAEGDAQAAIEHFRNWDRVIGGCGRCVLPALARAFEAAGQADSARATYARYVESPRNEGFYADAWELARAYQRLGELYEAEGDNADAATYYGEFVELWANADPEFQPVVEDVKRRIARLVGEGAN